MDMIKNSWLIILMLRKAPSIIIINNKNNNNNNNNNIIIIIMHLDGPQVPQPRLAQAAVRHVPPPAPVLGDLPPDYNVYVYNNILYRHYHRLYTQLYIAAVKAAIPPPFLGISHLITTCTYIIRKLNM